MKRLCGLFVCLVCLLVCIPVALSIKLTHTDISISTAEEWHPHLETSDDFNRALKRMCMGTSLSCRHYCGEQGIGSSRTNGNMCSCDPMCLAYGDCCWDFHTFCPHQVDMYNQQRLYRAGAVLIGEYNFLVYRPEGGGSNSSLIGEGGEDESESTRRILLNGNFSGMTIGDVVETLYSEGNAVTDIVTGQQYRSAQDFALIHSDIEANLHVRLVDWIPVLVFVKEPTGEYLQALMNNETVLKDGEVFLSFRPNHERILMVRELPVWAHIGCSNNETVQVTNVSMACTAFGLISANKDINGKGSATTTTESISFDSTEPSIKLKDPFTISPGRVVASKKPPLRIEPIKPCGSKSPCFGTFKPSTLTTPPTTTELRKKPVRGRRAINFLRQWNPADSEVLTSGTVTPPPTVNVQPCKDRMPECQRENSFDLGEKMSLDFSQASCVTQLFISFVFGEHVPTILPLGYSRNPAFNRLNDGPHRYEEKEVNCSMLLSDEVDNGGHRCTSQLKICFSPMIPFKGTCAHPQMLLLKVTSLSARNHTALYPHVTSLTNASGLLNTPGLTVSQDKLSCYSRQLEPARTTYYGLYHIETYTLDPPTDSHLPLSDKMAEALSRLDTKEPVQVELCLLVATPGSNSSVKVISQQGLGDTDVPNKNHPEITTTSMQSSLCHETPWPWREDGISQNQKVVCESFSNAQELADLRLAACKTELCRDKGNGGRSDLCLSSSFSHFLMSSLTFALALSWGVF